MLLVLILISLLLITDEFITYNHTNLTHQVTIIHYLSSPNKNISGIHYVVIFNLYKS